MNISTKLKFENILFGCLRQVDCLIEVTANSGLTVNPLTKRGTNMNEKLNTILYKHTSTLNTVKSFNFVGTKFPGLIMMRMFVDSGICEF